MSGHVFSVAAVLILGVIALVITGGLALWVVPIALVAVLPLFAWPLLKAGRDVKLGSEEPAGVPSTAEASYQPQMDPADRG
jgi:Flp pilus assembly protein TadB